MYIVACAASPRELIGATPERNLTRLFVPFATFGRNVCASGICGVVPLSPRRERELSAKSLTDFRRRENTRCAYSAGENKSSARNSPPVFWLQRRIAGDVPKL